MSENETVPEPTSAEVPPPPLLDDDPSIGEYFQRSKEPLGEDKMLRGGEHKAATDD
jgi:hypothetical protein